MKHKETIASTQALSTKIVFFLVALLRCTVCDIVSSQVTPKQDVFLSKALVYYCVLVFRRIHVYISVDLFYFVSFTSSCSLILSLC